MARRSELIKHAEQEIIRLEANLKKLNVKVFNLVAEIRAYRNLIKWTDAVTAKKEPTNGKSNPNNQK